MNKIIATFTLILAITLAIPSANARKIKTKHIIPKQSSKTVETDISEQRETFTLFSDSITFTDKIVPAIRFYGFDKTVGSRLESFFVSNGLESTIGRMEITITYFDMQGRQLHKRCVTLSDKVPAHETLRTDIKSWDTQKSFYFHQSAKPKRQATPFSVKIQLLSISLYD